MGDWELLQAYTKHRSEAAFTELVQHHLDWVYSAARRQVGDPHLAEDVAQSVFILLARKAGDLRPGTILTGWLFRTTRFVAARAMRTEQRRKKREEIASAMIITTTPDDNEILWNQLAPHLDQAVAALSETDRSAILLRFYEQKPLREVGERLGMSEEAAKKRVSRAVEKMRDFLTRRGVVLGGAGLIAILAEQTVQAAPATLAVAVLKVSVAGASASAALPELARETLNAWRWSRLGGMAAGIAAVSVTGIVLTVNMAAWRAHDAALRSSTGKGIATALRAAESGAAPTPQPASHATAEREPATKRSINIHVVDAQAKQPLAGVEIGVKREDQKTTGRTDEEGSYQLELTEKDPSSLSVTARKDGFVPMRVIWNADYGTFRLPEAFTFTLEPATSIGGIVQDEQGNPIAGATGSVRLHDDSFGKNGLIYIDELAFKKVVTDGLGRWRFDQAQADLSRLSIRLTHPDYISDWYPGYPNNAKIPDERLRNMTAVMVMKKGLLLEGVVLDENGRPIQGAKVLQGRDRWGSDFPSTKTDVQGHFRFASTVSGEAVLTIQAEGYAPELRNVNVDSEMKAMVIRLAKGGMIRGRVVDKGGKPIAGAWVGADTWRGMRSLEWRTETDAEGRFVWTSAPPDEVQFFVGKQGYMSRNWGDRMPALKPSEEEQVVTLAPAFIAQGLVTDAETGQPINSFKLTIGLLDEGQAEPYWSEQPQQSCSDGRYEWNVGDSLGGSRRCVLRAEADGYAQEISPPFDHEGESFVHDFKLARATWIQGVVRTPDGQPAANVEVFLVTPGQPLMVENGHKESGRAATSVRTGADGRFKFSPTDKPFLVVALHDKGYAQAASEHAGTLPDLLLRPWARIDGAMYIGSRPAVIQKVHLWSDYWSRKFDQPSVLFEANTMTDDTGHFLLDHVPAGEVLVGRWICVNERSWTFTTTHCVDLHTDFGQTAHVTIGGTGRPVVGQLVVPAGFEQKVDWSTCNYSSLHTKPPERLQPTLPNNWQSMTDEQKRAWGQQWQKAWDNSEEGKAYHKASMESRHYPFAVRPDGSLRVEDVLPGIYQLDVTLGGEPHTNGAAIVRQPIAWLKHEFTVPEMPDGRSDEPLDLGDIELQPVKQQE